MIDKKALLTEMVILADNLDEMGLKKDAEIVDGMITKVAQIASGMVGGDGVSTKIQPIPPNGQKRQMMSFYDWKKNWVNKNSSPIVGQGLRRLFSTPKYGSKFTKDVQRKMREDATIYLMSVNKRDVSQLDKKEMAALREMAVDDVIKWYQDNGLDQNMAAELTLYIPDKDVKPYYDQYLRNG